MLYEHYDTLSKYGNTFLNSLFNNFNKLFLVSKLIFFILFFNTSRFLIATSLYQYIFDIRSDNRDMFRIKVRSMKLVSVKKHISEWVFVYFINLRSRP